MRAIDVYKRQTFKGGAAQTIGDYNNAFMQLDSGMIDAVACDLSIACLLYTSRCV